MATTLTNLWFSRCGRPQILAIPWELLHVAYRVSASTLRAASESHVFLITMHDGIHYLVRPVCCPGLRKAGYMHSPAIVAMCA